MFLYFLAFLTRFIHLTSLPLFTHTHPQQVEWKRKGLNYSSSVRMNIFMVLFYVQDLLVFIFKCMRIKAFMFRDCMVYSSYPKPYACLLQSFDISIYPLSPSECRALSLHVFLVVGTPSIHPRSSPALSRLTTHLGPPTQASMMGSGRSLPSTSRDSLSTSPSTKNIR